jgi:hypothetical protein
MRLDIPAISSDVTRGEPGGSACLARLLAGIVNAAKAGRRFDQLIVVGDPLLRAALIRYFSHDACISIVAQLDSLGDLWAPEIASALYTGGFRHDDGGKIRT